MVVKGVALLGGLLRRTTCKNLRHRACTSCSIEHCKPDRRGLHNAPFVTAINEGRDMEIRT